LLFALFLMVDDDDEDDNGGDDGHWATPNTFGQDTPAFKQRINDRASPLVRFFVKVISRDGWRYFFGKRSFTTTNDDDDDNGDGVVVVVGGGGGGGGGCCFG
jgi:hypothetical protein